MNRSVPKQWSDSCIKSSNQFNRYVSYWVFNYDQ